MNRRTFIQTILGSAVTLITIPALASAKEVRRFSERIEEMGPDAVKDLLIWAPFEAFLPEQTNVTPDDPNDGTETGTLKADDILKGQAITFKYWHGHNGVDHMFTVTADQLQSIKAGNPTVFNIPTTVVEDHYHFAIVDPSRPA